jgi:hypothetical protein
MLMTERTINDASAPVPRSGRSPWHNPGIVRTATTGMLQGKAQPPDIHFAKPYVSSVIIAIKIAPAVTVEPGARIRATGHPILSSIAPRGPDGMHWRDALASATDHFYPSAAPPRQPEAVMLCATIGRTTLTTGLTEPTRSALFSGSALPVFVFRGFDVAAD